MCDYQPIMYISIYLGVFSVNANYVYYTEQKIENRIVKNYVLVAFLVMTAKYLIKTKT